MIAFETKVVGIARVSAGMTNISDGIRKQLRWTMTRLAILLQGTVKEDYLNLQKPGPGGLHVESGTLRRSINFKTSETPSTFTATVGTNVSYGKVWELGFAGTQLVKPHIRSLGNVMGKVDIGGGVMKRRKIAQQIAYVKGHKRDVNNAPRPFLQPALDDHRPEIRAEIMRALVDAGKKATANGR